MEKIGSSQDDAAGESYDKVAKMMGLGYPGWPIIGKLASEYTGTFRGIFPNVLLNKNEHDFSFSGLKSAVKREVDKRISEKWSLDNEDQKEIAFEFEQTVVNILSFKLFHAAEMYNIPSVMLAWWVSANDRLKETIEKMAQEKNYRFLAPIKKIYSQDNAAMVWILGYYIQNKNLW